MEESTFSLRNIVINYVKHAISVLYYGIHTRVEKSVMYQRTVRNTSFVPLLHNNILGEKNVCVNMIHLCMASF